MAAFTTALLAGGLALGAVGTTMQFLGMQATAKAQKEQTAAEMGGERTRQAAMQLDATRRTREALRMGMIARGQAENQAANTGSQYGSMLPGVEGQISNQTSYNVAGVQGQRQLGQQLSGFNMEALSAGMRARSGQMETSLGGGLTSLGGSIMSTLPSFTRLGYYSGLNA
jgi:hypothetical protein